MSWINRLFVAVLLFPFVWAIVLLVEKRALRSTPPGERLLYPTPSLPLQHSELTQHSLIDSKVPSQYQHLDKDAKSVVKVEVQSPPLHKLDQPQTDAGNAPMPVIVLPWRSSFSLSPRSTLAVPSSTDGRKGSLCPRYPKESEGDTAFLGQDSAGSELAGIGDQFPTLQVQNRQLSFS